MFQHVGWSLRHVLFSDMFSAVSNLFSTSLVYACPVYGRSGMLFLLLISRGTVFVFASFVLLACLVCYVPACWMVAPACCFYHFLHVYLPACFFFPRVSACLILACSSTVFFRPAAFLAHTHTLVARCWSCSWQAEPNCATCVLLRLFTHVLFMAGLCYLTAGCAT